MHLISSAYQASCAAVWCSMFMALYFEYCKKKLEVLSNSHSFGSVTVTTGLWGKIVTDTEPTGGDRHLLLQLSDHTRLVAHWDRGTSEQGIQQKASSPARTAAGSLNKLARSRDSNYSQILCLITFS